MNGLDRMAAVAATEFRLAFRNRWVLLSTLAFTLFALALAFLGSGPSGALKVDALTLTAASLSTLTVYLVPLMALLVSYDSIAGEIERGTLALVLATPVKRGELVLAKFCGHLAVLTLAIAVGYGIAGLVIAVVHGANPAGLVAWGRLVATAVLLGAVFVAVGMMLSGLPRQTGTAAAMAIGAWLVLVVLYDLALLGAVIVDRLVVMLRPALDGGQIALPDIMTMSFWMTALALFLGYAIVIAIFFFLKTLLTGTAFRSHRAHAH